MTTVRESRIDGRVVTLWPIYFACRVDNSVAEEGIKPDVGSMSVIVTQMSNDSWITRSRVLFHGVMDTKSLRRVYTSGVCSGYRFFELGLILIEFALVNVLEDRLMPRSKLSAKRLPRRS